MWLIKFLLFLILWKHSDTLLIRPINVYQNIIAGMHERYKFDALTLLHGQTHYNPSKDIELTQKIVKLQIYFAKLWIPTAVMSINVFNKQEVPRINQFQKHFFVFLNDFDDLRNQLTPDLLKLVGTPERLSLIFFRDKTKAETFFENMYIPLNCQFMIAQKSLSDEKNEIITEVYRFAKHGKLHQDFLTSWNPVTGMQLPKMPLHHRRTNFSGYNINIGLIEEWSYRNVYFYKDIKNLLALNLINVISNELNLNVKYHKIKYLGSCGGNGTSTYAFDKLISKEIDIVAEPITTLQTCIQKDYVDFTMTAFTAYTSVFYQKPRTPIKWTLYRKLFHSDIWIALGVHIVMFSLAIIFIEYMKKVMLLGKKLKHLIPLNVSDIFFRVWSTLNNQSIPYSTYNQIQVLQFITYLLFMITYAVYSAKLVSLLAANPDDVTFHSLEEIYHTRAYKVGMVNNSQISLDEQVNFNIKKYQTSIHRSLDGFYRVCKDPHYVFIDFKYVANYFRNMINNTCELKSLKDNQYQFTFVLQKNSPLKRYVNRILIKFAEFGIHKPTPLHFKDSSYLESISAIDLPHVLPLFFFLGASILLSIGILFCEIVVHKLKFKQYIPTKSKRIWSDIKLSSKSIYRLRLRALKAKHRRANQRRYNLRGWKK